jgi:hypothetical protein
MESTIHSIKADSALAEVVNELISKGAKDSFIIKEVFRQRKIMISPQAIYSLRLTKIEKVALDLKSKKFSDNLNALLQYLQGLPCYEYYHETADDGTLSKLLIVDLLSANEFALAPHILFVDFSHSPTTTGMPLFFVFFLNSNGEHTTLAYCFSKDEVRYVYIYLFIAFFFIFFNSYSLLCQIETEESYTKRDHG